MGRKSRESMLGKGVYRVSEIARYTNLHPQRVRSWFTERDYGVKGGPLFLSDYPVVDDSYGVSFLDLIDVKMAGQLRESGVSMRRLRKVYNKLKSRLGTNHPFSHSNIYTDGREVIILAANEIGDEELVEVLSEQKLFLQAKTFLRQVEYNNDTQMASRWNIAPGVVIDPNVSFGKPVVKGTGITTFVLANQYIANDENAELVADLFDVSIEDVLEAVQFEQESTLSQAA